jgi:hypothetical protein
MRATYGDGEGNAGDSDERYAPSIRQSDRSSCDDCKAVLDDNTGRHAEETSDLLRPIADYGGEVTRRVLVAVEEGNLSEKGKRSETKGTRVSERGK